MVEARRRRLIISAAATLAVLATLACAELAAAQQDKKPAPSDAVWTKSKILICDIRQAQTCRSDGCAVGPKAPAFRVDLIKRTLCGMTERGCINEQRIGQIGFDPNNTRMALHALGFALVLSVEAAGAMNGADVVRGRVVVFHGQCRAG
jgi:hypothetical protein